jgi:DNA-binding transcriptional LysR family regulator
MKKITYDLDALRSLTMGIDAGSFAKAAVYLCKSTSAISAHLKKLEEQTGQLIVEKDGRHLKLTPAGEILYSYAKRMLALNDEAVQSLGNMDLAGTVRVGFQEDFSEHLLANVLAEFSRAHPNVAIEACIARNAELIAQINAEQLDLALAWAGNVDTAHSVLLGELPLHWIGRSGQNVQHGLESGKPIPLVLFEAPCLIRQQVLNLLDEARIPWRIVLTSQSLAGIWSAVNAGLGLTVRSCAGLPQTLQCMSASDLGLPQLPPLGIRLHRAKPKDDRILDTLQKNIMMELEMLIQI